MMATQTLFTPLTLGGINDCIQLQHRIVMAPLSRFKADDDGILPDMVATYYEQRSTPGGLIIAEATNIAPSARGFPHTPGLFSQAQIDAWQAITKAVHMKQGIMFAQLWHTGRASHPLNQPGGILPVSSSANYPLSETRVMPTLDGPKPVVTPRVLETHEIPGICRLYRIAAENAITAGFDGIEVHASNGFLPEQFIFDGINDRTDEYGGSVENRARFLFDMLDEILQGEGIDSSKVGVRLSPYNIAATQTDSDPVTTYTYILEKLNDYNLAYVHLIEPRDHHYANDLAPEEGVAAFFRKIYHGVVMTASGYDRDSAIKIVEDGGADLVAIGRNFISNPDLVKRFQLNAALTPWDRDTFYTPGPKGFTDYPFMEDTKTK